MKKVFLLLFVISSLSCSKLIYSDKFANKYIDKLYQHNPEIVRAKSQQYYQTWYVVKMSVKDSLRYDSMFKKIPPLEFVQ